MPALQFSGNAAGRVLLVGMGAGATALAGLLEEWGWHALCLARPAGALRRLHDDGPDLLLLAPSESLAPFLELCRHVKLDTRTALVPVIFALPAEPVEWRAQITQTEADDCFFQTSGPAEIHARLSGALRLKRAADSLEDAAAVLKSLANAIEGRDLYTRGHVERVSTYGVTIGRRLGLGDADLGTLQIGGVIHDIGKVAVPDQILNKPGALTPAEYEVMRRHPVVGYDVLQPLRTFRAALPIVRWHHERPNGRGYPDGIGGAELPLLARIVAVADVFDALSTARAYRPAMPPAQCRAVLEKFVVDGDLDGELVQVLLTVLEESALPPGSNAVHASGGA